jgi:DNA-binding MarR family transcriptional regulator
MGNSAETISEVIDNLRRTIKAINEYSKSSEKETGLTGHQLWAIKLVADYAPIKVSDLARQMYLHPATVVGILDRLASKGLVRRSRSTEDKRVVEIDLTAQGRAVVNKVPDIAEGMLAKKLETLPEKRLSHVSKGMREIACILGPGKPEPQRIRSHKHTKRNHVPQKTMVL